MIVPFLTVTAIGLWTASSRRGGRVSAGPIAGAGVVGAWLGFLAGAVAGGVVDLVLFGGFWPVLVGHVGAVAVSRLAVSNRARAALPG